MEVFLRTVTEHRKKMNIPEYYVEQMLEEYLHSSKIDEAAFLSVFRGNTKIDQRIFAGMLLSLIGCKLSSSHDNFIYIPASSVEIGSDESEIEETIREFKNLDLEPSWLKKEQPRHIVEIKAFRISKSPVTNADYLDFLKETQHPEIPTTWYAGRFPREHANNPVSSVGPRSAKAYCDWRTKATGQKTRLPTEFEWEYAAGGGVRRYPWGDRYQIGKANLFDLNILGTTPVGAFPDGDSFFGCSDMAGNVEEWTSSQYRAYPGGKVINDWFYINQNDYLVTRGGSWNLNGDCARVMRRHAGWYASACGFRIVEEV